MSQVPDSAAELAALHTVEPLLVADAERVRFVNQAFADLMGQPLASIIGSPVDGIISVLGEPIVVERLRSALRQRQPFRGEAACHAAGGTPVPIDLTVVPIHSGGEELVAVSALDLRHQKRLEHQLRFSQRLDAVAQLTGGISHEMNDAIQVISGFTGLGGKRSPARLGAENLRAIEEACRRVASLLTSLLEFTRPRRIARVPVQLNGVIAEWEHLLAVVVGSHVRLIKDLAPNLPTILGDRNELRHILINLVSNARDAMGTSGTLTIRTHEVAADRRLDHGGLDEQLSAYVVLTVSDTGTGMTPETKTRLFQPFFSTKGEPGARGLGLATVQEIVRETGGLIWVRSQVGAGTSVEVHFPVHHGEVDEPVPPEPANVSGAGTETVLLVDDEPGVLLVTKLGLEQFGYRVLAASSAAEATAIAAEKGAEIAALVTDVIMPGQRGPGLAEELLADWPHLKVLFISGYPGDEDEAMRRAQHLNKPFAPEELARTLRNLFDG